MIGDEGAVRRRRSKKVVEAMHPLGTPVSLPRRKPPALACDGDHGSLHEMIDALREKVGQLEQKWASLDGKVTVLLALAGGTFVTVLAVVLRG